MSNVYLVSNNDGKVKIGRSKSPRKRVCGIRTGSATGATLIAYWRRSDAIRDEKALHKLFDAFAAEGEWFDLEPDKARVICEVYFSQDIPSFVINVLLECLRTSDLCDEYAKLIRDNTGSARHALHELSRQMARHSNALYDITAPLLGDELANLFDEWLYEPRHTAETAESLTNGR